MRLRIRCGLSMWKGSCWTVFLGDSGDKLERFQDMTIAFALIQTVEKIAKRSSPKARVTELIVSS